MKKKIFKKAFGLSMFGAMALLGVSSLTSCSEKKENDFIEVNEIKELNYGISLASEETYTMAQIQEWCAMNKDVSSAHNFAYNYVARLKSYKELSSMYWEDTGEDSDGYGYYETRVSNDNINLSKNKTYLVVNSFYGDGNSFSQLNSFWDYPSEIMNGYVESGLRLSGNTPIEKTINKMNIFADSGTGFTIFTPSVDLTFNHSGDSMQYDLDYGEPEILPSEFTLYEIELYSYDEMAQPSKPNFETTDYYYPVNVNNPVSIETILSSIKATDETDGDVSENIKLESTTYNPETLVLGTHDFNVSVSDKSGNTTYATYYITVYDLDKPTISGTDTYSVSYDTDLTMDMIKQNITMSDNFTKDLTLNVVSDTFTGNENKVGNYVVAFNTTDEADNTSYTFSINIEVYDKIAPVITCPSTIEINNLAEFTLENLQSKISVIDGYDGALSSYTILGFNNYLNNSTKGGTYVITIKATDSNNNISTATINLIVSDKVAPYTWFFSGTFIQIQKGEILTKDMIVSYLTQIGEITPEEVVSVSLEENEENNVVAVSIVKTDGSVYKTIISAVEYNEDGSIKSDVPVEKNGWEKFWDSVVKFFKGFGDFFVKLFTGKLWSKDVENDETIVNVNAKTINDEVHYNQDGVIDNQFVVYEYDDFDCGNEPAVIPELDTENSIPCL